MECIRELMNDLEDNRISGLRDGITDDMYYLSRNKLVILLLEKYEISLKSDQEKKKEAIAFADWINSPKCEYQRTWEFNRWTDEDGNITTEQLYDIYKKQL